MKENTRYTELEVTTNFSFLRGASHPEEIVDRAAAYGYNAIAITDRNSVAGIVRGHVAAKAKGMRIIPACRLDLLDGPGLLAYPKDIAAYGRLSALLTKGNLRAEKGDCHLYKADVYAHKEGIQFIVIPPAALTPAFEIESAFVQVLREYRETIGVDLYLAATRRYLGDDAKQLHRLSQLSTRLQVPLVATNDVHYHEPDRRFMQDVLTCIREKCIIDTAGYRLHQNAERHLKTITEMQRLFRHYPDALYQTQVIAEACLFSLDTLQYVYPEEHTNEGRTPQEELTILTWEGAHKHFGTTIPEKTVTAIHHELGFIGQMNYASYFLTVHDLVRFARQQNILCQGRGSAANSTVCYCLGITSVNPTKIDLLFERFLSASRNEPPDIDVDFEHERREEVIQYVYQKYGRDRAAIVATVTQERQKGAIRDVGKAMGLSIDTVSKLSSFLGEFTAGGIERERLIEQGFNPDDRRLRQVLYLTQQLRGFPRQLGQHTGGFVITQGKLSDLCPILNARMEDRTCIEWNKDDIDALGFLKIDVLALGMLTCIRKAFELAREQYGLDLTLANIPEDDPAVYDMICRADTIGVFQIESRAQMAMLPRLKPRCFYDLVIEVAIVRPGPIQGDMVHPYLRRRDGLEPIEYPSKELEEILSKTKGVPLFQEQAMKISIVAAGFSPAEADELRRSMATFKSKGMVAGLGEKLINGMLKNGYTRDFAERIFKQLEGFGSYGFPESHAASFALLVYVSSWIKCYYPDVFACALLNSMPMGFYQPAQIVIDARKHGVEVRPVDVNASHWDNTLEVTEDKYRALRLGFRQVKGLRQEDMQLLVTGRAGSYTCIDELHAANVPRLALEKLARANGLRSLDLLRRQGLWELSRTDPPIGLFVGNPAAEPAEEKVNLPQMTAGEHVLQDYAATSLSLEAHPVSFVREKLQQLHIVSTARLQEGKDGDEVKVAGLVLVRQRPETASGVVFITIEDETGIANLVVFRAVFDKYRKPILQSRLLMVEGKLQREGEVIHVVVRKCYNLSRLFRGLMDADNGPATKEHPKTAIKEPPVQTDVFGKGRNFK